MSQLDSGLATFVAESRDLLEEMESALLSLQNSPATSEVIDGLFRAAHTIKGAAGLFELTHVVTFTHAVETVLDEVRKGKAAAGPELLALLLACGDHIRAMVE